MITPNLRRLEAWRQKMRREVGYYDLLAHVSQRVNGIDWDRRRPCRAGDEFHIERGRIRIGHDGYLPRQKPNG